MTDATAPPEICEPGFERGVTQFVPFFGEGEQHWPPALRALLYFLGLAWMFLGVSIIADIFMAAIEEVCMATYTTTDKVTGKKKVRKVWNATVANLSLMALGSSAPEIFLNVIGIFTDQFYVDGGLGPSTIVGSAAFNLMVIGAVCVSAIPSPEIKKIKVTKVYMVTASYSIWAYFWLVVILRFNSPNVVTPAEGIVSFLFFPLLLLHAWCADHDYFSKSSKIAPHSADTFTAEQVQKQAALNSGGAGGEAPDDSEQHSRQMAELRPPTRATYRARAMQAITGKKPRPVTTELPPAAPAAPQEGGGDGKGAIVDGPSKLVWESEAVDCYEADKKATLVILRTGGNAGECSVDYATADISAAAGRDYTAVDDTLTFKPGEVRKELHIEIIDDNVPETDEKFRVVLKNAMGAELEEAAAIAIVTIKQTEEDKRNYTLVYRLAAGDKCKSVMEQWKDQFKVAMSAAGDGDEPVTGGMMATHVLTVFFKVTFAVVPPTPLWGGWAAFVVGILMIAVVTMMISDLATFFGCVVGLPISINAITLVGVGTSLPDTFASKRAAIDDDTADNSIGNITGSNCVNVFLGLGLPWMIGALYWSAVGRTELWEAKYGHLDLAQGLAPDEAIFVVPAGGLVFSVIIFVVCALTALLVLQGRRMAYGGELGGPAGPKKVHAVFLVSLWLIYLMMSILYDVGVIPPIS